jgi:NADPH-dependent 2,4-dienoyl-CoA reductase/sulfur reductase-like enzyme/nitrite reductase/ring-hydroxylating ferredoxin subunit
MDDMEDTPKRDLKAGVPLRELPDGTMLVGEVEGEDALLVRRGDEFFAVGAYCTHYHGPLADGLVAGDTVRCPWHHACFNLLTGEALRAPALDPIACWRVERVGDRVFVRERVAVAATRGASARVTGAPASVVIVGGGAAGLAAAEMLRREGYDGTLTILSADDSPPVDRPNLSKDFLAGTAPDDWIPLRAPEFYADNRIDLRLGTRVTAIDVNAKRILSDKGAALDYGALVLATGAEPVKLDIPGAASGRVLHLRTFADSKAIVAKAQDAKRALVVGASFIGLEVAASLRARGIEVHVVGPEAVPLERVMGPEVGRIVREIHESHGVVFHLGRTVGRLDGARVTLSDGTTFDVDFVVVGVGVRPVVGLAERAGIATDRGVAVDAYLETNVSGVYAAGDIARWPDPHTREKIRVEHWVVAERQGQVAARNILGRQRQPFDAVPFFWSQHYDVAINYVGHAEKWDAIAIDGSLAARDCAVSYSKGGQVLAVATLGRDLQSLRAELAIETAER